MERMKKHPHSKNRLRRQSARQRKKKYVGEFQELVFVVKVVFVSPLTLNQLDRIMDDVIEYVEARGLSIGAFGGGEGVTETEGWVEKCGRGSVTEEQRSEMLEWLRARPEVANAGASALFDGFYDRDDQLDSIV